MLGSSTPGLALTASGNHLLHFQEFHEPVVTNNYLKIMFYTYNLVRSIF